jgi:hypothetical protein
VAHFTSILQQSKNLEQRDRSSALLVRVTRADQRRPVRAAGRRVAPRRAVELRAIFLDAMPT